MTENFDEYLRKNPMPTKLLDNENYKIVETKEWNRWVI